MTEGVGPVATATTWHAHSVPAALAGRQVELARGLSSAEVTA